MSKEIDINNEEEILKECDFDYFYESEDCSHELCMFYNDIQHQNADFNCKQAHIDLGRIAITLNKQSQRIAELEERLKNAIPKFKYHQVVYVLYNNEIIKGEIDCFDYFNKNYLVFLMKFDLGNEWFYEHEIFTTKEEAQAKLEELSSINGQNE